MEFAYGSFTHRGHVRAHNEDCLFVPAPYDTRHAGLCIVADGMGGYNAGDVASRVTVQYILDHFDADKAGGLTSNDAISAYLKELIEGANHQVFTMSSRDGSLTGMGTTLTMAWLSFPGAYVVHVGDSRCYLIRGGEAAQVTKDHSLVQQLVDAGQIRESDMYAHPQKNIITRAVGTDNEVVPDIFQVTVQPRDTMLLCSDGFINHVDIKQYTSWFEGERTLDQLAADLGQKALDGGGTDNITLVLARPIPTQDGED
jgi:serine/threonine protein phosphatase PrpC